MHSVQIYCMVSAYMALAENFPTLSEQVAYHFRGMSFVPPMIAPALLEVMGKGHFLA